MGRGGRTENRHQSNTKVEGVRHLDLPENPHKFVSTLIMLCVLGHYWIGEGHEGFGFADLGPGLMVQGYGLEVLGSWA